MFKLKRSARIKAIQSAAAKVGMDAEVRRELQRNLVGKSSLTEMTLPELDTVLDAINAKTGVKAHYQGKPASLATDAQLQKIEALLADQGLPWAYLTSSKFGPSMLKRLAAVDKLEWASPEGKAAVIAALAKRQEKQAKAQA